MTLGDAVQRAEACFGADSVVTVKETLVALEAARQAAGDGRGSVGGDASGLLAVLCHRAGREFPTPLTDDARLAGLAAAEVSGARDVMVLGQLLGVCSPAVSEGGFDIRPYFVTEAVGPQHPANDSDVERVDAWLRDADLVANSVARDVAFNVALGWAVDFDLVDKGQEWLDVWHGHDGVSEWHLLYYGVLLGVVDPGDVQEELFAAAGDCADRVLLSVAALVDAYRACGECGLALALVPVAERAVGGVVVVESLQRVVNAYGPLVSRNSVHNFVLVGLASLCVQRAIEFGPGEGARMFGLCGGLFEWTGNRRFAILVGEALVLNSDDVDDLGRQWRAETHGVIASALNDLGNVRGAWRHSEIGAKAGFGNPMGWIVETSRLFWGESRDADGAVAAVRRGCELLWVSGRRFDAARRALTEIEYVYQAYGFEECLASFPLWYERAEELEPGYVRGIFDMHLNFLLASPYRFEERTEEAVRYAEKALEMSTCYGRVTDHVRICALVCELLDIQSQYPKIIERFECKLDLLDQAERADLVRFVKVMAIAYEQVGRVDDADELDMKYGIQY